MANLQMTEERARQVLCKLKAWWELSDEDLARMTGLSRQSVSKRINGHLRISLSDLDALSEGLNVPRHIFFMTKYDAVRLVMEREEAEEAAQEEAEFEANAPSVLPIKSTFIPFTQVSTIAA